MRKIILLLTLTTIMLGGCSKDGDTATPEGKDINGRWYTTEMQVGGEWLAVKGTCLADMYAEFKADKSYSSYQSCDNARYSGTYSLSGDVITCKVGAATVTYTIIELNGNKSTLALNEDGAITRMKAERR